MPTQTKSRKGIGGPKTAEGKEKIRLNALKLGLYAKSIEGMQAVADVVGVTFEETHQKMLDYYHPADPLEETLVRRIARCTWKLMLVETMEDHLLRGLAVCEAPGRSLEGISVIERRTDVQLHRAIAALAHKRRQDRENEKNKLTDHLAPNESAAQPQPVRPPDSHLRAGASSEKSDSPVCDPPSRFWELAHRCTHLAPHLGVRSVLLLPVLCPGEVCRPLAQILRHSRSSQAPPAPQTLTCICDQRCVYRR